MKQGIYAMQCTAQTFGKKKGGGYARIVRRFSNFRSRGVKCAMPGTKERVDEWEIVNTRVHAI